MREARYFLNKKVPEEHLDELGFTEVVSSSIIRNENKNNFMQGYKTYSGLVVVFLGWLGVGDFVSEEKVGEIINLTVQLVGLIVAVYGNIKAHRQIAKLGGY